MIVRQKIVLDSDDLYSAPKAPDYYGKIYGIETIRQGQPVPTKHLISEVYASEFRLHVVLLQIQGFLSQVRDSFRHRTSNQITKEYRYYPYEAGKLSIFLVYESFI